MNNSFHSYAGMLATPLRWVVGWTYFSAFWRRLVLENKLNPDEAGYIGEKFNHFLPNALGIKPLIEYLVSNPDALWYSMTAFTIIEGIVGLLIMLGLFSRLMSVGIFFLATGILLGSGWLGTTCVDEWQIGILGVASGFVLFFTGGGKFSLDEYLMQKDSRISRHKIFPFIGSGKLPFGEKTIQKFVLYGSVFIFGLTLLTNQHFHGGVYGTLHNKSVRPHVTINNASIENSTLRFTVFRDEGADVYGSFLIGVNLTDDEGRIVLSLNQPELSSLPAEQIHNHYVAKVKPGKHSLILPLGAKADIEIPDEQLKNSQGSFQLELIDISGASWKSEVRVD